MIVSALTTIDNKSNPFTHYDEWFAYETLTGFRCLSSLAEFAFTSSSLSYEEYNLEIERAISEILAYDVLGIFKRVRFDTETQKTLPS